MSSASFFNKINSLEHSEAIDFLDHNQTEITLKINKQYVKTSVLAKKNDQALYVEKVSENEIYNESVICFFQIKENYYFFKSALNASNNNFVLDIPNEIFQLQRRNDFRASMPIGVIYKCEIRNLNTKACVIKTEIRDMSLGGCQISISNQALEIKQDDLIEIYLKLDKFEFMKLPLIVKHIKNIESQNYVLMGVSFNEINSELTSELQSLLMHLDRVQRGKNKE